MAHGKINVEHREVFLKNRPPALYDISPKGTVPVFQIADGTVIDESIDIMKWALDQSDSHWYIADKQIQDTMIHHNDTEFKQWLDKYKYHDRHPEYPREYYRQQCADTLSEYESKLSKATYLMGEKINLVDVAIFPFVRQCANVDRVWFATTFPHIENWLEKWITSPIFTSIMPKLNAWEVGDEPLYISYGIDLGK